MSSGSLCYGRQKVIRKRSEVCKYGRHFLCTFYLDGKQIICKCWQPVYSGQAFQYCMEPLHRCLPSPWRRQRALLVSMGTLFNVSLSAYQNCTKRGRKTGWAEGAREREREEKSNNAISTGSLNDATLATIWHSDKRGPDIFSSKTGLFFAYIPFCRQEDRTPPQSFSCELPEPFCDSPIIPIVPVCTLAQKRSALCSGSFSELAFSLEVERDHSWNLRKLSYPPVIS